MLYPKIIGTLTLSLLVLSSISATAQTQAPAEKFVTYTVPAISSIPRLPHKLPQDGELSNKLQIVAAQGEFEPASFVLVPQGNVAKLQLTATALTGAAGQIPATAVDIKVVKTWYQAGTAWHSFFSDRTRREMVPELLLNDETLVKVDRTNQENYLRISGKYQSISYPEDKADKPFNYLSEPVADAKTLKPLKLVPGENKQVWVTLKVSETTAPGIYKGKILFDADGRPAGSMSINLRVLPFSLPTPKTYYDIEKDYLVTLYGTGILELAELLKIPQDVADKQQMAIYKNLIEHNVVNVRSMLSLKGQKDRALLEKELRHELRLMKKAGTTMKPLLSDGWVWLGSKREGQQPELFKQRIDAVAKILTEEVGHSDIYLSSWDEAGPTRIKQFRELAEYSASKGMKIWMTTWKDKHFDLAGYAIDYSNHGGWPTREQAATWHAIGSKVASYAGPHSGIENPNVYRLWEGLARYKANYDGSFNYKYFSQIHPHLMGKENENVWNDFLGSKYRQFNLVYPTSDGVVDTIAWEGFREGIDDVRYATKLKEVADVAISSGKMEPMFMAKKALMWLELLDVQTADLNAVRMEMIQYILKIENAMAK